MCKFALLNHDGITIRGGHWTVTVAMNSKTGEYRCFDDEEQALIWDFDSVKLYNDVNPLYHGTPTCLIYSLSVLAGDEIENAVDLICNECDSIDDENDVKMAGDHHKEEISQELSVNKSTSPLQSNW